MFTIGVRAHDYPRQPAASLAQVVAAAGFRGVQLAPAKALEGVNGFEDITDAVLDDARSGFSEAGVRIDVYGCYQEIGDPDAEVRALAVDRFCRGVAHAARLGAPIIATETSHFSGTDAQREAAYEALRGGVIRMAREAERLGVLACIEPVIVHTLNSARLARRLLDEVASPNLAIVFDPVNMLTSENLARQDAIWDEYFELLGPAIAAVHLKDVDGQLAWTNLGRGIVHYDRIFPMLKALNRDLPLLREGAVPDSAGADIEFVRRMTALRLLLDGGL